MNENGAAGSGEVYIKPEEAARILGLSTKTLANLRHAGGGPRYVKLGSAVRYPRSEVYAWAEDRGMDSTDAPSRRR